MLHGLEAQKNNNIHSACEKAQQEETRHPKFCFFFFFLIFLTFLATKHKQRNSELKTPKKKNQLQNLIKEKKYLDCRSDKDIQGPRSVGRVLLWLDDGETA